MRTINTKRTVTGKYNELRSEMKSVIDFSRTHRDTSYVTELAMAFIDKCEEFADAHKGSHAYFTMMVIGFQNTIVDQVLV